MRDLNPRFTLNIVSIFPQYFDGPLDVSLVGRARERGVVHVSILNPKDFVEAGQRVDDYPYGGGAGMVVRAEPVIRAVESIPSSRRGRILAMSAAGRPFRQSEAEELSRSSAVTIICGRYEGIDQRAFELLGAEEFSVVDCVLAGGEAAALVVAEATIRLIPGVMGNLESAEDESHVTGVLEYPHYTRPRVIRGLEVPPVLVSGDHDAVARWRREQSLLKTARYRMDLLSKAIKAGLVSPDEAKWLEEQGIRLAGPARLSEAHGKERVERSKP
ncbi:MAG: tRNA (guanosine(37)-N1)-methyltransferase TrmD [Acidimicrobiia bacterium]